VIPSHLILNRASQTGMDPKMATARTQEVNAAYVELENQSSACALSAVVRVL